VKKRVFAMGAVNPGAQKTTLADLTGGS
jgi:hypothetical protein